MFTVRKNVPYILVIKKRIFQVSWEVYILKFYN